MFASRFGRRVCQERRSVRYAYVRLYRPCGDSPRLRMPLGAAASEEVHLNLAYRWFCRLGLGGKGADHVTFSKNRSGRFRESDASGDAPRGSLRNHALAQLIGTNGGSSGFASRE